MNGIKHAKAIKNLKLLGKTIPENISTVIPPANPLPNTVDPNTSLGELSGFDISEEVNRVGLFENVLIVMFLEHATSRRRVY